MSEHSTRITPKAMDCADPWEARSLAVHLERYRFAARFVRDRQILDVACGVGYGSRLLADEGRAEAVLGVDIDPETIRKAREDYGSDHVAFVSSPAEELDTERVFDVVCSMETIEHVVSPDRFMTKVESVLRPGGMLVCSVPITVSTDVNPYHLHDFTRRSFRSLLRRHHFAEIDAFEQQYRIKMFHRGQIVNGLRWTRKVSLMGRYLRHPGVFLRRVGCTLRYGVNNVVLCMACKYEP